MIEHKLSAGDLALLKGAQTGEGLVELTPDLCNSLSIALKEREDFIEKNYPKLVEECPEEMKLAVTAWVIENIVKHAMDGGTFRYLIYDRLGFGPEAYIPLYGAGGMTISNEFVIANVNPEEEEKSISELRDMLGGKTVTFEYGKEAWIRICGMTSRLEYLARALSMEQEKRRRLQQELEEVTKEK